MKTRITGLLAALLLSMQALAQSGSDVQVSGTVIDTALDEPFIGVMVQAVGTTLGTATDMEGHFTIEVPTGTELRFSFIGYKPVSYIVNGAEGDLRIEMWEDSQALEELVVIGYGSSRKEDLSTSISTMSVGKELKSGPSNLASVMQGRLPGVTIQNSGGDPLSGAELNIRGKGSRGGDAVLYVVDGVPGAPFNIEDVENITVLKDAASAAIYGASVGSGGVIVVTTKKGKSGRFNIDFNGSYSFKNATKLPAVTTAGQYVKVWNHLAQTEKGVTLPSVANVKAYPFGAIHRTDWMDEIFRTGSLQHYAVTLSGGNDKLRSILSLSYDKNEGILLNTRSEEFGGRLNADYTITDWLSINQNINVNYTNGQGGVWDQGHEGILMDAAFFPTSATVYELDRDGNPVLDERGEKIFGGTVPTYYADQGISGYGMLNNPVATLMRLRQNRPATTIFSTTGLTVKPLRGLELISRFSVRQDWSREENFTPEVKEVGSRAKKNSRSIGSAYHSGWLWETTATYSTLLADRHHISAMAGYTMAYDNWRSHWVEKQEYPSEDPHKIRFQNGTKFNIPPTEGITEESMISGFGRLSYSYDDRYFITGSLRNDLSSKLAPHNRSALFPAISGSWKISSESFMEDVEAIDLFKLRGSWGQVGNVAMVDPYAYNVSMAQARGSVFGLNNDVVYGFYQKGLSNTDLKWETTESWGVGLDLGLFGRLSLSADYFNKQTKDLIERVPIVPTMGVTEEPLGNVGSVVNKGWEFALSFDDRIGSVKYGLFGNLSLIHSEVLSLGSRDYIQDNVTVNSMQPVRSAVGQPWQSFYIYEADGIFRSDDEVSAYSHTDPESGQSMPIQPNAKAGDLKFVDQNGDGVINDQDRKFFGSYLPTTTYSFGGSLEWNGLDLSIMMQGIAGNKLYNAYKQMSMVGRGVGGNLNAEVLHAFNFDPNSGIPRLGIAQDANGNYSIANSYFLEDGGYLRLKNVTLGYSLPKSVMEAINLPNAGLRLYLSGENILTMTKYSGIDPEVGYYGIDAGRYPLARTFTFGINLSL